MCGGVLGVWRCVECVEVCGVCGGVLSVWRCVECVEVCGVCGGVLSVWRCVECVVVRRSVWRWRCRWRYVSGDSGVGSRYM